MNYNQDYRWIMVTYNEDYNQDDIRRLQMDYNQDNIQTIVKTKDGLQSKLQADYRQDYR